MGTPLASHGRDVFTAVPQLHLPKGLVQTLLAAATVGHPLIRLTSLQGALVLECDASEVAYLVKPSFTGDCDTSKLPQLWASIPVCALST